MILVVLVILKKKRIMLLNRYKYACSIGTKKTKNEGVLKIVC